MFGLFKRQPQEYPWILKAKEVFGLHEVRDKTKLSRWLMSDGKTLGDPSALPWCGDFAETVTKLSLPSEPITGELSKNPYWARNWLQFGVTTEPVYGAWAIFSRGANAGHVGFLVGQDTANYFVLGGNQGNTVSIVAIDKNRTLGLRWPKTGNFVKKPLPVLNRNSIPQSTNEF